MSKPAVDYSLYLVSGRDYLPPSKFLQHYLETLEEAIKGGVTVVQIREKKCDTGEFLNIARASQAICKKYNVPLLINDRIDIALAIGADGVHIGQTDMPLAVAKQLLPPTAIIGVSCNNAEQAKRAVAGGADYVGIGACFDTSTKVLTEPTLGPRGIGEILGVLHGTGVKAVAIGGIKIHNILRVLHGAVSGTHHALDGVAVVSDIYRSTEPKAAAEKLATIVRAFKSARAASAIPGTLAIRRSEDYSKEFVVEKSAALLDVVRKMSPLVHQITNNVVINQSANATLALGASPIMATAPQEMEDLGKIPGGLLINFGTIADKLGMIAAGSWANVNRKPVVFDPVGVGATSHRRNTANELLNTWQAAVIKGNAAEIGALANSLEVASKGVDSTGTGFADPAKVIKGLAVKERCVVVLTGKTDWITDGQTVVKLSNGHSLLGDITGSGCMVGTAVATFCGAASMESAARGGVPEHELKGTLYGGDMLLAAVGAVLAITVASEFAAARAEVKGPGTFLPAFIDELAALTPAKLVERAKVEVVRE